MTFSVSSEPKSTDDELRPISALNHLLFCRRRCALLHIERVWTENVFTLEGRQSHQKVHASPADEERHGGERIIRGLWLRSDRLRLIGVADLVEFRPEPYPVEYKRGRKRKWDNDDVQLCAQALCLEEMLGTSVRKGAIFNVKSKRRREIVFDEALRMTTERAVKELHALLDSGSTPPPVLLPKCKGCSVRPQCMPELLSCPAKYQSAASSLFVVDPE